MVYLSPGDTRVTVGGFKYAVATASSSMLEETSVGMWSLQVNIPIQV